MFSWQMIKYNDYVYLKRVDGQAGLGDFWLAHLDTWTVVLRVGRAHPLRFIGAPGPGLPEAPALEGSLQAAEPGLGL